MNLMADGEIKKAILFADVVGSTKLYSTLGDEKAQALVHDAIAILKDVAAQNFGNVVKEIGDAVLTVFEDAKSACDAAQFMVQYLEQTQFDESGTKLKVRVACHFGPVIETENDVFGNTVNLAARVMDYAKPSQILVTSELLESLGDDVPNSREYAKLEFKGISGEQTIHEIIVKSGEDESSITMASIDTERPADFNVNKKVNLSYNGKEYCVDANKQQVSLGRQPSNDIVIASDQVSRQHAMVQYQNGKFYLVDQSFNGTFVQFGSQTEPVKIHQGDIVLLESGKIIFHVVNSPAIEIAFVVM